jgi:hypothetical protein
MTDDEITEARAVINAGLTPFMHDSDRTREAKALARHAAADILTELRRVKMAIGAAQEA